MNIDLIDIVNNWWLQLNEWLVNLIAGLPQLLGALIVFYFFWYLSKVVETTLNRIFQRIKAPVSIERLLAHLARIATVLVGIMIALGVMDLDKTVTSMLAGLGIVGVALGFAFQDIAANFIAGLILVIRRPFRIGNVINVADQTGVVQEIELRSTIIKSFQGHMIHIPNKEVFSSVITNYSELQAQRVDLVCGVGYQDDLEDVQHSTVQLLQGLSFCDDEPRPTVYFTKFGDSAIECVISFWIDFAVQPDFLIARSEAIKAIVKLYRDKGFTIPYPVTAIDLSQQGAGEQLKK